MEEKSLQLQEGMELGKVFAESGVFPDIKSAAQGYIKILCGKELGLTPIQSLGSFYFVGGRIAITANTMASLIKKTEKYNYKLDKLDETECSISFTKGEEKLGTSTYTFKDAAKAGLVNKDNWKNHPKNMLFARSLSNGCKWFCPEVVSGYYEVSEMEDTIDNPTPIKTTVAIDVNAEVKDEKKS